MDDQTPSLGDGLKVSVVIPTTGRPSLRAAVRSALDQTFPVDRVVVAVDGPLELARGLPDDSRVLVVSAQGHGSGGNAARTAGMEKVPEGLVALLDDDDVWDPSKLEVQIHRYLRARHTNGKHLVVACRVREITHDGKILRVAPERLLGPGQRVADYLFERTSITRPGGMLNSSMLVFDRELAVLVPFDTTLPRHQDWDWLLRVDALSAAQFEMVPEVLVDYAVNPTGASTSSSMGWQTSEAWVARSRSFLTDRQQAEVLLSVTMPIALKHGDWVGAATLLVKGLRLGPAPQSVAFGIAHVPLLLGRRLKDGWRMAARHIKGMKSARRT